MSRSSVESQLVEFATALVENSGGIIDWQSDGSQAAAIVPPDSIRSGG